MPKLRPAERAGARFTESCPQAVVTFNIDVHTLSTWKCPEQGVKAADDWKVKLARLSFQLCVEFAPHLEHAPSQARHDDDDDSARPAGCVAGPKTRAI